MMNHGAVMVYGAVQELWGDIAPIKEVCYTGSSLGRNCTFVLPCRSSGSSLTVFAISKKSLPHAVP